MFNGWSKTDEIEADSDDYYIDEAAGSEESKESDADIKLTLEELKTAVTVMKDLLHSAIKDDSETETKMELPAEIFTDHIKISWDSRYTDRIKGDITEFVLIQKRLQEINLNFVELKISKYRYELLKDILVAKISHKLTRVLKSVY